MSRHRRTRHVLWTPAAWLVVFCVVVGIPGWVLAAPFEALKAGVVKVTSEFENGKRKIGTGFVIRLQEDEAYVVTASHVVEDAEAPRPKMTVTFYPEKLRAFPAVINKMQSIVENRLGLAVLRVKGELPDGIATVRWGTSDSLAGGEAIDFVGFPRFVDTPWAVTVGRISGWKGEYLLLSGTIDEGNSGGPIFLDGQVVGVVMETQGAFGYAVPSSRAGLLAKNWGILPAWPPVAGSTPDSGSPPPRPESGVASLTIHSAPSDAQVFLDDQLMGTTADGSLTLKNLDPDEYDVSVHKKGFTPWAETIEVYPGESRSVTATLLEGALLDITGTWSDPINPTLSYFFKQSGNHVTMQEVTTNLFGTSITAEGEGQLDGHRLNVLYRTILGTNGRSQVVVSDDGNSMVGSYQDLSSGLTMSISLVRSSD